MSSIVLKRMRSSRNPEKLDSRTGAIFTVHDATSRHFVLTRNSLVNTQFNELSDPDMRTANFEFSYDVYREGVYSFLGVMLWKWFLTCNVVEMVSYV